MRILTIKREQVESDLKELENRIFEALKYKNKLINSLVL
jgi:hypothetical protein